MSEFQKGLLLGIMIMSSMFLFTASTKSEVDSRGKIVEYQLVQTPFTTQLGRDINESYFSDEEGNQHFKGDWTPYGSPVAIIGFDNKPSLGQAMVRYEK